MSLTTFVGTVSEGTQLQMKRLKVKADVRKWRPRMEVIAKKSSCGKVEVRHYQEGKRI